MGGALDTSESVYPVRATTTEDLCSVNNKPRYQGHISDSNLRCPAPRRNARYCTPYNFGTELVHLPIHREQLASTLSISLRSSAFLPAARDSHVHFTHGRTHNSSLP